jgi:hypothetical protein
LEAINNTDIFTLDDLYDLPSGTVFSYQDDHGDIFAFSAPELHYEVCLHGPKNPYNRKIIPQQDIDRLNAMMKRIPQKVMPKPEDCWRHPEEAFAYVLGEFERQHGIRANVEWLTKLTRTKCVQIFYIFHGLVFLPQYMSLDELNRAHDMTSCQMILAKEMWKICQATHEPNHMYIICNLFFAIAQSSTDFKRYLPNWVLLGASGM